MTDLEIIELFRKKALHFTNEEIGIQPFYAEINSAQTAEKPYCYSFSVQYKRNHDDTTCESQRFLVKKLRGYHLTYLVYLASGLNHAPSKNNSIRWGRYTLDEERKKLIAV